MRNKRLHATDKAEKRLSTKHVKHELSATENTAKQDASTRAVQLNAADCRAEALCMRATQLR